METKIIGNKIAEARKKTNISQAQLAQRLFISAQAVGKWERGESMPDIITLNRLAEILDVDLNYFSGSDLSDSHIQNSSLNGSFFKSCRLNETEFSGSALDDCDFSSADFTRVTIKSGAFFKNTIANAVWSGTSYLNTQISDIAFEGTIDNCSFEFCSFKMVTFNNATIMNTFFKNKMLKGIRFKECQADRMTYEFLKNGKVDLTGIRLLTS